METITFKVSPEERRKLEDYADQNGLTISKAMRLILQRHNEQAERDQVANELRQIRTETETIQASMRKQAAALMALVMSNDNAKTRYQKLLSEIE